MYNRILAALDGSDCSDLARDAVLSLAEKCDGARLIGCHAYSARLHRARFGDMEPGLPDGYRGEGLIGLRETHEGLIAEGMQLISDAYLEPLAKDALAKGFAYESVTPEGRNYLQILKAAGEADADLLVVGACGQGRAEDLGSTAERILLYSQGADVLLMRKPWTTGGGSILVGIDGSDNSYAAMRQAVGLAKAFDLQIEAVSIYDPFFHSEVFKNIAASLPEKAKEHFDLSAQEKIHDEVIDEGLKSLYSDSLKRGIRLADGAGIRVRSKVMAGKVCTEIQNFVSKSDISLIILGRWGLHREHESMIGSNALRLARSSTVNVLIVSPEEISYGSNKISGQISKAGNNVNNDVQIFGGANKGKELSEAEVVVMHKIKRFAPDFHRHMLRGKINGQIVRAGDRILVYEVDETVPRGPVQVTERTRLEVR